MSNRITGPSVPFKPWSPEVQRFVDDKTTTLRMIQKKDQLLERYGVLARTTKVLASLYASDPAGGWRLRPEAKTKVEKEIFDLLPEHLVPNHDGVEAALATRIANNIQLLELYRDALKALP